MAIVDLGAELQKRIMALPDHGLEKVKGYLRTTGQERLANSLSKVEGVIVFSDTLRANLENFNFASPTRTKQPPMLQDHKFHNGTPVPQKETFRYTITKENEFSFGFTEGLTVGLMVEAEATVPLVGAAKVQVSAQFEFTAQQQWTYRNIQSIETEYEIEIPPHSSVDVKAVTQNGSTQASFKADAVTTGGVCQFACLQGFPVPSASVMIPITAVFDLVRDRKELTVGIAGTVTGAAYLEDWVEVVNVPEGSTGEAGIRLIPRGALPQLGDTGLRPAASA